MSRGRNFRRERLDQPQARKGVTMRRKLSRLPFVVLFWLVLMILVPSIAADADTQNESEKVVLETLETLGKVQNETFTMPEVECDVEDIVEEHNEDQLTSLTETMESLSTSITTETALDVPTEITPTETMETSSATPLICPLPVRQNTEATGKHRFNYASIDCAALVLKANPEATSVNAILSGNKDTYMLNKCTAAEKYIIVELCQEILIDTIVLASFEFFSSMVKDFEVYVSDRYPPREGWKLLGKFQARNLRSTQVWKVQNPAAWARYMRIDFKSHHGNEVYCPLTLLRIHGQTVFEELKQEEEKEKVEPIEQDSDDLDFYPQHRPKVVHDYSPAFLESDYSNGFDEFRQRQAGTSAVPPEFAALFKTYFGATPPSRPFEPFDPPTPAIESVMLSNSATPSPTAQEGVLRSMLKRLSVIERNTTQNYKYLEEQSILFNDYFGVMFTRIGNLSYHMQLLSERLYSERIVARERIYRERLQQQQLNEKLSEMSARIEKLAGQVTFYQTIQSIVLGGTALAILIRFFGIGTLPDADSDVGQGVYSTPVRDFIGGMRRGINRSSDETSTTS